SRLLDQRLLLHLPQILHNRVSPLRAIPAVTNPAFAELAGDLHLQPQCFVGGAEVRGVEESWRCRVEPKGATRGGQDDVTSLAMGELATNRRRVMHLADGGVV